MGKIFRRSTSTSSQQSKSSEFELEDYNVEDLLSIGILSYDLEEESYYVFWIEVKTRNLTYKIPRRFSEFHDLHSHLKSEKSICFLQFPTRTFFKVKSVTALDKRKRQLNAFLKYLNIKVRQIELPELMIFLEFNEFTKSPEEEYLKRYQTDYKHDKELIKFLFRLNFEKDNRLTVFRDIEEYMLKKRPRFTNKFIKLFMQGDPYNFKGFFRICSTTKDKRCHFVSAAGLSLLEKFMQPSFCKNNSEVVFMFTRQSLKKFEKLNLLDHIGCMRQCKNSSLELLNLYLVNNPVYLEENIIKDEKSLKIFRNWRKLNKVNYCIAERFEVKECAVEGQEVTGTNQFFDFNFGNSNSCSKHQLSSSTKVEGS